MDLVSERNESKQRDRNGGLQKNMAQKLLQSARESMFEAFDVAGTGLHDGEGVALQEERWDCTLAGIILHSTQVLEEEGEDDDEEEDDEKAGLGRLRDTEVFRYVPRVEMVNVVERQLIKTRWVVSHKGAEAQSGFVAREFAKGGLQESLFVGSPPIFAERLLVSSVASLAVGVDTLTILNISCAFLSADVERSWCVGFRSMTRRAPGARWRSNSSNPFVGRGMPRRLGRGVGVRVRAEPPLLRVSYNSSPDHRSELKSSLRT